jgi:hypothetical protein
LRSLAKRHPQVDKIVAHLMGCVTSSDLRGLSDFWEHLSQRFFARMDSSFNVSIRKLELRLRRYYLICAVQNNRHDKAGLFSLFLG